MAQTPEANRSERITQKLEALAQDPDLGPVFDTTAIDIVKNRCVWGGGFTPDQYGRVLTAFSRGNLSTEEIKKEVENIRNFRVVHLDRVLA